jgi:hypothetical protein
MLDEGTHVLQKPFAPSDLVRHTREVMNGHVAPSASSASDEHQLAAAGSERC